MLARNRLTPALQARIARWVFLAVAIFQAAHPTHVRAQANLNPVVLRTGSGQPLVSQMLTLPAALAGNRLVLDFGFATGEVFGSGRIFDSFTVSAGRSGSQHILILAVLDASGAVFVPPTTAGPGIDPALLASTVIPFPALSPDHALKLAYRLSVPLDGEFAGGPLDVYFDLFDNQDTIASLGFFGELLIVPEPPAWLLGILGMGLLCRWRKRAL